MTSLETILRERISALLGARHRWAWRNQAFRLAYHRDIRVTIEFLHFVREADCIGALDGRHRYGGSLWIPPEGIPVRVRTSIGKASDEASERYRHLFAGRKAVVQ